MAAFMERMKKRYGLARNSEVWAILTVYSLAGMSISFTVRPLYNFEYHYAHPNTPFWIRVITYILVAVPVYQCFLLIYGFLFRQFKFFWEREKKLFRWIVRKFSVAAVPSVETVKENSSENI